MSVIRVLSECYPSVIRVLSECCPLVSTLVSTAVPSKLSRPLSTLVNQCAESTATGRSWPHPLQDTKITTVSQTLDELDELFFFGIVKIAEKKKKKKKSPFWLEVCVFGFCVLGFVGGLFTRGTYHPVALQRSPSSWNALKRACSMPFFKM
jgi:hypothetical protein